MEKICLANPTRMFRFRFDYSAGPLKPACNDTLSASGGRGGVGGVLDITLCLVIGVLFRVKKKHPEHL